MKKSLLLLLLFCFTVSYGQIEGTKEISKDDAEQLGNIKKKGIKFGVSFGFNQTFDELVDARISPIDTTLTLQNTSKTSFLLSTTLSFPILSKWLGGGSYYRKLDGSGNPVGDPYFVPSGLSIVTTINLVTFNSALGGAGLFNQKLDGGLGLGYTFGENVQLALTYEMISFRQPRDFLKELNGQTVEVNGSNLMSLSLDDNDYFIDKYMPSVSLKIVYLLN
ncbi:hypothetical protein [Winogradskyella luteola]|uniref:Outer membrane protein beta-barrel domain-containing protein n=1 Tax=Winogradskyella luteola TaxID=2828330 RepID=A0A9X1JR94_9FLAO|nr:hypothetical protein [Winogradskyella luteola]MBV7270654.1 hypothetical protein [Winogradskyella luteola]